MTVKLGSCLWIAIALAACGCTTIGHRYHTQVPDFDPSVHGTLPKELAKTTLPTYVIEPPDLLIIEAIHIMPKHPYHLRTADLLTIQVQGTLPDSPIMGQFAVEPGGLVNFGLPYGTLKVSGMTVDDAQKAIEAHLKMSLREPVVSVALAQMSGQQQIAGEHLVAQDGVVTFGSYGSVYVAGMTLSEARAVIEQHLAQYLDAPEISIGVAGYNSKVYYIVREGAGNGDSVVRFPITGNETVLDALCQVNGFTSLSSKRVWIARPSPYSDQIQILPVDWVAIAAQGVTTTNYQILPGDRIFVAEDKLVAFDTRLGKLFAPFERIMGFMTLGVGTVSRFSGNVLQGGSAARNFNVVPGP